MLLIRKFSQSAFEENPIFAGFGGGGEKKVFTLLPNLIHSEQFGCIYIRSGGTNMWFYSARLDEGASGQAL